MGFHDRSAIPFYYALADRYTVCDRWFASVMGPTFPNRFYLHAGTSFGLKKNSPLWDPKLATVWDRMHDKGLAAKNYTAGLVTFYMGGFAGRFLAGKAPGAKLTQFFNDAKHGTLPPFSIIDPDFLSNDDHPSHDINLGQALMASIVAALARVRSGRAPCWSSPTTSTAASSITSRRPLLRMIGQSSDSLASRVPSLVIGPTVHSGRVCHTTYDHTSVLATLRTRYGITDLTARMAAASDLSDCIGPPRLVKPSPPPVGLPRVPVRLSTALRLSGETSQPELAQICDSDGFRQHIEDGRPLPERIREFLAQAEELGAVEILDSCNRRGRASPALPTPQRTTPQSPPSSLNLPVATPPPHLGARATRSCCPCKKEISMPRHRWLLSLALCALPLHTAAANDAGDRHQQLLALFAEEWELKRARSRRSRQRTGASTATTTSSATTPQQVCRLSMRPGAPSPSGSGAIRPGGLSQEDQLNRELLQRRLELAMDRMSSSCTRCPLSPCGLPHPARLVDEGQPFHRVKDYENYLARLTGLPRAFAQIVELARRGVRDKRVQPRYLLQKVVGQAAAMTVLGEKNPLAHPLSQFPATISEPERQRLRAAILRSIDKEVVPAYRDFARFVAEEYANQRSRRTGAVGAAGGRHAVSLLRARAHHDRAVTGRDSRIGKRSVTGSKRR